MAENNIKLLIVTQKVNFNDDVLGFMHGWIEEFAKKCGRVTVLCLEAGRYNFPQNVRVFSLGKTAQTSEQGFINFIPVSFWRLTSRFKYILNFYSLIWKERKNYDIVFVHMNQEYVLLGGFIWRLLDKKIGLWYAHGHVPWLLRIAGKIVDIIFTSTKSGCRLKSDKIRVVGQGINVNKFKIKNEKDKTSDIFRIISVGRISPVKDYETLISAAEILKDHGLNFVVNIIGEIGLKEQEDYLFKLKKMVSTKKLDGVVKFFGSVPNKDIQEHLSLSDLFVNTSRTGSLDKAILEAMSVALPVLTCNEALISVLKEHASGLMFDKGDYGSLARLIMQNANMSPGERKKLGFELRDIVVSDHGLEGFVSRILSLY